MSKRMQFFNEQRKENVYLTFLLASLAMGCATNTTNGPRPNGPTTLATDQIPYGASPDDRLRIRMHRALAMSPTMRVSRQSARVTLIEFERAVTDSPKPREQVDAAIIQNVVRGNFRNFVHCYEEGLRKNPDLRGDVKIQITIDIDGKITRLADGGSDMPDANVTSCVIATFGHLVFPKREHPLTIVYPVKFSPGDGLPPDSAPHEAASDIVPMQYSPPHVILINSQIILDGKTIATVDAIGETETVRVNEALFRALSVRREQWLSTNRGAVFPGIAGLRMDVTTSPFDFKNVFQTLVQAGYQNIFLQDIENPATIVELGGLAVGESASTPPKEIIPELHLVVDDTHIDLFWQQGLKVISQECYSPEQFDSGTVCESWKINGYKRHLNDDQQDLLVIHTRGNQRLRNTIKVIQTIESCTREVRDADNRRQPRPVFWTVLSMR
jgi:hypothetical protein